MSTSFFTSQKLLDSKNIRIHLEYLRGNIASVHPADTNDRTRREARINRPRNLAIPVG